MSDTKTVPMMQTYVMGGLLVVAAFVMGMLFTEVRYLKKGGTGTPTAGAPTAQAPTDAGLGKPSQDTLKKVPKVTNDDIIRGDKNAKVTLIEYSDLECPFCQRFHPTTKQVLDEYKGKVRLVFRHYPLTQIHPNAQKLAEMSECLVEQKGMDAFWTMADDHFAQPFQAGGVLTNDKIADIGVKAGGDKNKLIACLESGKYTKKVNDSVAAGSAAGVAGTPATIIVTDDGQYDFISGALPFEQVKAVLDQYVK